MSTLHIGRSWTGHDLEDTCPCPKTPCGLVATDATSPDCTQHTIGKTIRQAHRAAQCPGPTSETPMPEPSTVERPIDLLEAVHAVFGTIGAIAERLRTHLAAQAALGRILAADDNGAARILDEIPAADLDRVGQAAATLATACGLRLTQEPSWTSTNSSTNAPTATPGSSPSPSYASAPASSPPDSEPNGGGSPPPSR
jgi:hypothetical protein